MLFGVIGCHRMEHDGYKMRKDPKDQRTVHINQRYDMFSESLKGNASCLKKICMLPATKIALFQLKMATSFEAVEWGIRWVVSLNSACLEIMPLAPNYYY